MNWPVLAFVGLVLLIPLYPVWALVGLLVLWIATPSFGRER